MPETIEGRRCKGCGSALPEREPGQVGRPRLWCTTRCRQNTWDRECYRKGCADCGADIDAHGERCRPCELGRRAERHEETLAFVERLYNEGRPTREIAEALGYGPGSKADRYLVELRRAGRVGYRYKAYEQRAA